MASSYRLQARLGALSSFRRTGRKSVRAAFPGAFPPLSSTMLPFLYQTRTLTRLSCMRKRPILQARYTTAISRRSFSRCAIRSDDHKPTYTPSEAPFESQAESTNSMNDQDSEDGPNKESEVISFYRSTAGSGGFDTETGAGLVGSVIRRTPSRAKVPGTSRESNDKSQASEIGIPWGETDEVEFEEFGSKSAPEDFDNFYEEQDEIDRLTSRSELDEDRTSTITPSEKVAFQKIFSDIFARTQPGTRYGTDGLLGGEGREGEEADHGKMDEGGAGARAALNNLAGAAIQEQSREDMEAAIRRYPPALRGAAARAIGLRVKNPVAAAAEEAEQTMIAAEAKAAENADRLEQLRKPERDRVEGLMRSAGTDYELWAVLEKEVFPLIAKMGLEEASDEDENTPAKKKGGKKGGKKASRDQDDTLHAKSEEVAAALDSPVDGISPLEFYGPLYPSYLLLGLRLLNNSFARPSPLTLTILPQIKSLGIISHVLGASTQLYNELLQINWYRHDNFRGVLSLLQEMEEFGLEWDTDTLRVIEDIMNTQNLIRNGDRGATLSVLWSLPEFAPDRFRHWKSKITKALKQARGQDTPQSASWARKTIV